MTEPKADDLKVQEPGTNPTVDGGKVEALAEGTVGDLAEALDSLDDAELEQLLRVETAGKARTTALGAIQREIDRRAEPSPGAEPEAQQRAPIGDAQTYAQMRASEVDPTKLTAPVLTRDGWVCPHPSAQAQG